MSVHADCDNCFDLSKLRILLKNGNVVVGYRPWKSIEFTNFLDITKQETLENINDYIKANNLEGGKWYAIPDQELFKHWLNLINLSLTESNPDYKEITIYKKIEKYVDRIYGLSKDDVETISFNDIKKILLEPQGFQMNMPGAVNIFSNEQIAIMKNQQLKFMVTIGFGGGALDVYSFNSSESFDTFLDNLSKIPGVVPTLIYEGLRFDLPFDEDGKSIDPKAEDVELNPSEQKAVSMFLQKSNEDKKPYANELDAFNDLAKHKYIFVGRSDESGDD